MRDIRTLASFSFASRHRSFGLAVALALVSAASLRAQDELPPALRDLKWKVGPSELALGSVAEIAVPPGYRALGGGETRKVLELMQNTTDGSELGLVGPDSLDWFVVFEYDDIGYVKDDEKGDLDADAMLKSMRQGQVEDNEQRAKRGWAALEIEGWAQPPRYDEETQNLVWAIRLLSEGQVSVNYNTRRLGRGGVMSVALVVDPEDLDATVPEFNRLMENYTFRTGQKYGEWREGDKVAAYGLTALVTGGAAAIAVKTGLVKWLWKAVLGGILAIGALFKAIFRRKDRAATE